MRCKLIMLLGTLLTGLFLLGGSMPAAAHGNHHRATPDHAATHAHGSIGNVTRENCRAARHEAGRESFRCDLTAAPKEPLQPAYDGSCCCGGIMCHAGVATVTESITFCYDESERIELPVMLAVPRDVPGGIERPPRAGTAL